VGENKKLLHLPPLGSLALGLSFVEPQRLHLLAPGGFLAEHFMHMYLFSNLASASGNDIDPHPN